MSIYNKEKEKNFFSIEILKEIVKNTQSRCSNSDDGVLDNAPKTDETILFVECLKMLKAIAPFLLAVNYLKVSDREFIIEDKETKDFINQPLSDLPNWNEVFDSLINISHNEISFFLAQIECNNEEKNLLYNAIVERKREDFIDCVKKMGKESYALKNLADKFELTIEDSVSSYQRKNNINQYTINSLRSFADIISPALNIVMTSMEKCKYSNTRIEALMSEVAQEDIDDFSMCVWEFYLLYLETYEKMRNKYPKEVVDIIDPLIVEPEGTGMYNELLKRDLLQSDNEENEEDDVPFDNLQIFKSTPDSDKTQYFSGLNPQIVDGGDDKFHELVDYIASCGYIENTGHAKQLFTFRLTGRCKPTMLEKLYWDGKEKRSPNELIYVIRFATIQSHSKYKKMKEFFEGPVFPDNNTSACADGASIDFRNKLKELYPEVFKIKDISRY